MDSKRLYKTIESPAIYYNSRILSHTDTSLLITERILSTIITQTWAKGNDERRFFLFEDDKLIWFNRTDKLYLKSFPIFSVTNNLVRLNTDQLDSCCIGGDDLTNRSITYLSEYISRGSYTYHFGHFIFDIIPLLIDIDLIKKNRICNISDVKLLAYPLSNWHYEILELIKRPDLVALMDCPDHISINHLNTNIPDELSYSYCQCEVSFVKQSEYRKLSLLSQGFSSATIFDYKPIHKNILILSRQSCSQQFIQRWINEKHCIAALESYNVEVIEPSSIGPLQLVQFINQFAPFLILGSAGSAFHQLLIFDKIPSIVAMIVSGRNYNSIWHDQIIDFKYAVNRMNIIYPYSLEPKDWNDPFNLNLNDFVQLISDLKVQHQRANKNINLSINSIESRSGVALL